MSGERQNIQGTMGERETMEAFIDNAKKSIAAAYEMAKDYEDKEWAQTGEMLQAMCANGVKLMHMRALSKFETAMALNVKTGLIS